MTTRTNSSDKMKRVAVLQSNYIPWRGYFDLLNSVDEFIIYDEVQYTKNDWRNRNIIKTKNGNIWLTIPVSSSVLLKICEVETINSLWQKKHYKSIVQSYAQAPFIEVLRPYLEELYLIKTYRHISEINHSFICFITNYLNIKTKLIMSSSIPSTKSGKNDRLIEILKQREANVYITGPAGLNYLDIKAFAQNDIKVQYIDYQNYVDYPQIHGKFSSKVSIVDTLMMLGPQTIKTFTGEKKYVA